jgi:hypothetical protein
MQAVDTAGGATRFELGRVAARELIDGLGTSGSMSLILVGHQPEVLAAGTANKAVLRQALEQAQPSEIPADWEAAMALAAGSVRAADEAIVVVISDGGLPENLPPMPAEVRYLPVGASGDNLALQALALRATAAGPQLFASVANYGERERSAILSISIDGQLTTARELAVPAGGTADLVLDDLPAQAAVYQARLSLPAGAAPTAAGTLDALPLDDTAWAVYQPPGAGRVLLISPGNVFLEQVFTALAGPLGLQPFRLKQDQPLPPERFDLYVFDGVITDTLPAGDLLLVNPPPNPLFEVGGTFTNTRLVRVAENDPLTRFVDWRQVNVLQARQVDVPAWARVLVEGEGGPLVFAGETGGRRVAVLTFDLHASDLPLQVTYPVLMANLLNYLAPAQAFSAPDGLRPGEALTIRTSSGDNVIAIEGPDGQQYGAAASEAGVIFADTHQLGVYQVFSNQARLGAFAVNLFDPDESAIRPAASIRVGRSDVAAAARAEQGQLEVWPWLAVLAFGLLLLEWWLYHRGATLPAPPRWQRILKS